MRDINRIPIILNRLEMLWKQYPDLRLGQLIGNYLDGVSLYYREDEELIEILETAYNQIQK